MGDETRTLPHGDGPTNGPARRVLPLGIITFLGIAFVVAAVNGAQGLPFVALLVAMAFSLILIVSYVAFGGSRVVARQAGLEEFGLERERFTSSLTDRVMENWKLVSEAVPKVFPLGIAFSQPGSGSSEPEVIAHLDEPHELVEKYVRSIVPVPRIGNPTGPEARQQAVDALREEARGLIRLAKVIRTEVGPYREFVVDARKAAVMGRTDESLNAIRLANELLRASIEKSFTKYMQANRQAIGVGEWSTN